MRTVLYHTILIGKDAYTSITVEGFDHDLMRHYPGLTIDPV